VNGHPRYEAFLVRSGTGSDRRDPGPTAAPSACFANGLKRQARLLEIGPRLGGRPWNSTGRRPRPCLLSSGPAGPHRGHIWATNEQTTADNTGHHRLGVVPAHRAGSARLRRSSPPPPGSLTRKSATVRRLPRITVGSSGRFDLVRAVFLWRRPDRPPSERGPRWTASGGCRSGG
jgi:hypothetical protein